MTPREKSCTRSVTSGVRRGRFVGWLVAAMLAGLAGDDCRASTKMPTPYVESQAPAILRAAQLEQIPLPFRQREVSSLLVHREVLWVGTVNGLFAFDGIDFFRPALRDDPDMPLIVNDLAGLTDGSVLVGTINGAVLRATPDEIVALVELGDRSEFSFAAAGGKMFIAESFCRMDPRKLAPLQRYASVTLVRGCYTHLAVVGQELYGATDSGQIFHLGNVSGDGREATQIANLNLQFLRELKGESDGLLYAGTDEGVFAIDPASRSTLKIAAAPCRSAGRSRFGTLWVGCDSALLEYDGTWRRWIVERAVGVPHTVVSDNYGNLWFGASGLWRAFDFARTVSVDLDIDSASYSEKTGLVVASVDGRVSWLSAESGQRVDILPAAGRQAVIARAPDDRIFALHDGQLWKLDPVEALGPAPTSEARPLLRAGRKSVWLGERQTGAIWRWEDGWQQEPQRLSASSGAGVADIFEDSAGNLWASSADQLWVRDTGGTWHEGPAMTYAPQTKANRWATFWEDGGGNVFVYGPWGYACALGLSGGKIRVTEISPRNPDQPWLPTSAIRHPDLGTLLATDNGLYRLREDQFKRFDGGDERLAAAISWLGQGAQGVLAATRSGIVEFVPPQAPPRMNATSVPAQSRESSVDIAVRAPGLAGAGDRRYFLAVSSGGRTTGPLESADGAFRLRNLADGAHQLELWAENAMGEPSVRLHRTLSVSVPVVDKKWFWPALALLAIAIVAAAATSVRFTGLALRMAGRRRWNVRRSPNDMVLEVRLRDANKVQFAARSQTKQVLTSLDVEVPVQQLAPLRELTAKNIDDEQARLKAWSSIPEAIRYALERAADEHVQLSLDDELLDSPWEMLGPETLRAAGLQINVGRLVLTDVMNAGPLLSTKRPRALIVAPRYASGTALRGTEREVNATAALFRRMDCEVVELSGNIAPEAVLAQIRCANLFHFVGHAGVDPERGGELDLGTSKISALSLHDALSDHRLALAFVNACSSGTERPWINGGSQLYGLASPFIQRGAYFLGAQWPIQDLFACEFATVFYSEFLPVLRTGAWANWLGGKPVRGKSFGAAVRQARRQLFRDKPTLATWSAYVAYGDPSVYLSLET